MNLKKFNLNKKEAIKEATSTKIKIDNFFKDKFLLFSHFFFFSHIILFS